MKLADIPSLAENLAKKSILSEGEFLSDIWPAFRRLFGSLDVTNSYVSLTCLPRVAIKHIVQWHGNVDLQFTEGAKFNYGLAVGPADRRAVYGAVRDRRGLPMFADDTWLILVSPEPPEKCPVARNQCYFGEPIWTTVHQPEPLVTVFCVQYSSGDFQLLGSNMQKSFTGLLRRIGKSAVGQTAYVPQPVYLTASQSRKLDAAGTLHFADRAALVEFMTSKD